MDDNTPKISIVLGSKNRINLLKATINSIRKNEFSEKLEIIVIDGGSNDGSCSWLAKQTDILTIIQPNYKIVDSEGISVLYHSWGNFMNIGFKYASSEWVVMISDDLILAKGALQNGYDELVDKVSKGNKIGGGAFYFREYPRHQYYRVGLLPKNYININHGFYYKKALKDVDFIDEKYNFYCADGDLAMKLNDHGWKTIALENSFADHLVHKPTFGSSKISAATKRDLEIFNNKYPYECTQLYYKKIVIIATNTIVFWKAAFLTCLLGLFMKLIDKYRN